eukprot:CAMPEP_0184652810 /NCGR_PEP_ID=MMETSP0308-20130426/10532_1 /TAXON_ID=38269 /ORGANISM="Gloeochaete witrockiana, Strain SAG 46.84" /LENGTH=875 /DNA_ID=CAMNT_0027087923 /DNA_START=212 /DNA_END=2839 /DNA_ORIENTATION=+
MPLGTGPPRAVLQTIYPSFDQESSLIEILRSLLELSFSDEDVQYKIVHDGGLPVLVYLACNPSPQSTVQVTRGADVIPIIPNDHLDLRRTAAAILAVSSLNVANHLMMVREAAMDGFIGMINHSDTILQMHGAAGLAAIAANKDKKETIVKAMVMAGAVPPLVKLSRSKVFGVLLRVAWALGNITGTEEGQKAVAAEDIHSVVKLASCGRAEVQCQAARVIANLATYPPLKRKLVEEGVIEPLSILASSEHKPVLRFVSQSLASLSGHPANRKAITAKLGVQNIVRLANKESTEVQLHAAKTVLQILSEDRDLLPQHVVDGCKEALDALAASRDAAVRKEAVTGLAMLRGEKQPMKDEATVASEEKLEAFADSLVLNALESSDWSVAYYDNAGSSPAVLAGSTGGGAAQDGTAGTMDSMGDTLGSNMGSPRLKRGGLLSGEFELPPPKEMKASMSGKPHKKKRMGNRTTVGGETVYKGHKSWDLMCNIQLGIRYSVGIIQAKANRNITDDDFTQKVVQKFPSEGSAYTPAHQTADFKFKDYAPMVWRHLREKFNIDAAEYMLAICGDDALRELGTPGKSGSVFYLSQDGRYVIKTVSKDEAVFLENILPVYYKHVMSNPNTLLTRFFGLHKIRPHKLGRNIRLVVMGNIFITDLYIHQRFDLKGSTHGRAASEESKKKPTVTLKDLDMNFQVKMEPDVRDLFVKQIEMDSKFLEESFIMDYSLLMGIHYLDRPDSTAGSASMMSSLPNLNLSISPATPNSTNAEQQQSISSPLKRRSIASDGHKQSILTVYPPLDNVTRESVFTKDYGGVLAVNTGSGERMLLFLGIIDFLQQFVLRKKLEHTYKAAVRQEGHSVIPPHKYADRFKKFMISKFIS